MIILLFIAGLLLGFIGGVVLILAVVDAIEVDRARMRQLETSPWRAGEPG